MPDKTFSVSLVTPDGAAFEGEAVMLIVPGADGEIGVLARHAPLIATLKAGSTRVHLGEGDERVREFATGPGFFKVEQDRAIALVDDAVLANEIDARPRPGAAREPRRPSSSGSSAASPRPTAGRSSSASGTPRTSSRRPARRSSRASDVVPRQCGCAICGIGRIGLELLEALVAARRDRAGGVVDHPVLRLQREV